MNSQEHFDIVIIGGGIAGLWTLNRLRQAGYQALLLEKAAVGGVQTIQAQGIIHGGIKYALQGNLTESARAMSSIPQLWENCLLGKGDIDLSKATILSRYHYLWSTGKLTSRLGAFFASKMLASDCVALTPDDYPDIFKTAAFKGQLYRVAETVVDTAHLAQLLVEPVKNFIYKVAEDGVKVILQEDAIHSLQITDDNGHSQQIRARYYIFTAGEGNEALLSTVPNAPQMQRRPLHMVWVRFPEAKPLFAHCIGKQTTPRITITTHDNLDKGMVWYLGGQLAEEGVMKESLQQIQIAQQECQTLFPWLNFSNAQWGSFRINRAEARQANGQKPDSSTLFAAANWLAGWPTKLAFAPKLANDILAVLKEKQCQPIRERGIHLFNGWQRPPLAKPIWVER